MAETPEDIAVHRFLRDLFEDLSLTLPSLGCAFEGFVAPGALTVRGQAIVLKNKLFLFFADLALRSKTLTVRFQPVASGTDLILRFLCTPFDSGSVSVPGWDPELFAVLPPEEGDGFRMSLPAGQPLAVGPPVHWNQLDQIYGGRAEGRLVLDQFLSRCPPLLAALNAAISTGDGPNVLRAAHTLKGSARGVTAHALAEAALQLEMVGRSGDLKTAPDLYKALLVTYDEFIQWVREGQT